MTQAQVTDALRDDTEELLLKISTSPTPAKRKQFTLVKGSSPVDPHLRIPPFVTRAVPLDSPTSFAWCAARAPEPGS